MKDNNFEDVRDSNILGAELTSENNREEIKHLSVQRNRRFSAL